MIQEEYPELFGDARQMPGAETPEALKLMSSTYNITNRITILAPLSPKNKAPTNMPNKTYALTTLHNPAQAGCGLKAEEHFQTAGQAVLEVPKTPKTGTETQVEAQAQMEVPPEAETEMVEKGEKEESAGVQVETQVAQVTQVDTPQQQEAPTATTGTEGEVRDATLVHASGLSQAKLGGAESPHIGKDSGVGDDDMSVSGHGDRSGVAKPTYGLHMYPQPPSDKHPDINHLLESAVQVRSLTSLLSTFYFKYSQLIPEVNGTYLLFIIC